MPHVLFINPIHTDGVALIEARDDVTYEVMEDPSLENIAARIPDADAAIIRNSRIDQQAIQRAGKLKVLSRHGVGFDNIDVDALTDSKIPLAVIGEANSPTVVEHTMAMILSLAKDLKSYEKSVRSGNWQDRDVLRAFDLAGKTLLVIGFGRIGTRIAPVAAAFGMNIIVADPNIPERVVRGLGYRYAADFHDVLGDADIITLHLPGSFDGSPRFGEAEFTAMRDGVIVVNCARGSLIDEDVLYQALSSGKVRSAGVDVMRQEPPPDDHPLFTLDNVIFTNHIAASTAECFVRMGMTAAQNALDAIDGKLDPFYVVNQEVLG